MAHLQILPTLDGHGISPVASVFYKQRNFECTVLLPPHFALYKMPYLQSMTEKPKLNLFDFTMIVVSLVIGMGIFRTPANVAAASPTPLIFFIAWLGGGIVALCGALTYAEIGSRLPVTGGYYKVFSYAYHPSIAFAINCVILVSNAASGATISLYYFYYSSNHEDKYQAS